MRFEDLNINKQLWNALNDLGYETPTVIQERAFAPIMSGRDVLGLAQTGTGKTIAYLLPLLRLWKFQKDRFPRILILVPTRELVEQVVSVVEELTTYMSVEVAGVYGGVNMKRNIISVENGLDILVGTPGRVNDLALYGSLNLKVIKQLVIDEVDEMLNLGFRHQLVNIFDQMKKKRQNLLFSATITEDVEAFIANDTFNTPIKIEAAPMGTPLENIEQSAYPVPNFFTKVNLINHLLETNEEMSRVLVFTATKKLADLLFGEIKENFEEKVGIIHSNKSQNNRFNTVNKFHDGTYRILIATDIVARGIDVSGVSHVINFDMPEEAENYIHRIGRTGRAERKGNSISFFTPKELPLQEAVENFMNQPVERLEMPEEVAVSELIAEFEKNTPKMKKVIAKVTKATGGTFHKKTDPRLKKKRKKTYIPKDKHNKRKRKK